MSPDWHRRAALPQHPRRAALDGPADPADSRAKYL